MTEIKRNATIYMDGGTGIAIVYRYGDKPVYAVCLQVCVDDELTRMTWHGIVEGHDPIAEDWDGLTGEEAEEIGREAEEFMSAWNREGNVILATWDEEHGERIEIEHPCIAW